MKITIDIPDSLHAQARHHAGVRGMTLKALVTEGLRQVMSRAGGGPDFQLRDASFHGGSGLAPEFQGAGWENIRDAMWESSSQQPRE